LAQAITTPQYKSMAAEMLRPIVVVIERLAGETLQLTLDASMSVKDVKSAVCKQLNLRETSFHLVVGTTALKGSDTLDTVERGPDGNLRLSMTQVDPLPELGQFAFDHGHHHGLFVVNAKRDSDPPSMMAKTAMYPDSSATNVLVCHHIKEACFVEFRVIHTRGEMSFGVTHKPSEVLDAYGNANRKLNCTWTYGKRSSSMVSCLFGGIVPRLKEPGEALQKDDLITVYVDPENKQVKFYRNGELIVENLPKYPLPELCADEPLRMFAMVHQAHDEVHIQRFGPGEPFEEKPKLLKAASEDNPLIVV